MEQLLRVLGDDFRYVEPVYCGPALQTFPDGSVEGYFGERYKYAAVRGRTISRGLLPALRRREHAWTSWTAPTFPAPTGSTTPPSAPSAEELRGQGFAVCCGTAGDMDFINGIARARGMEQVLMDLIDDNPVYLEIMQARFEFYYHDASPHAGSRRRPDRLHPRGRRSGQPARADDRPAISSRSILPPSTAGISPWSTARRQDHDAHVRVRRAIPAAVDRAGARRLRRGPAHDAPDGHRRARTSVSATG